MIQIKQHGSVTLNEEPIYEISKPYLKFETGFLIYQVFYDKICKGL